MNFVAMDFETASAARNSACSMALAVVRDNQVVDEFYTLIKPETAFDRQNIQIHGITPADVADAPKFTDVWPLICQFYTVNQLVVAHNAPFDNGVLKHTLSHYGVEQPHYLSLDMVRTSRKFYPDLPNHKLNTVAAALNIELEHHHNALDDTVAAAKILVAEAEQFGIDLVKPFVKTI